MSEDSDSSGNEDSNWVMVADGKPTEALVILDRSGGGQVSLVPVNIKQEKIPTGKSDVQLWYHTKGLRDFAAAIVDNKLYIIAGYDIDKRHCTDKVWRYDPKNNRWEPRCSLTIGRCKHSAAGIGAFIYVSGGEKTDGAVLGSCEQYHTETDAWSKIGALPSPRRGHACLVDGCRILHVSGGLYGRYGRKNLWAYEGSPIRWHELDDDYPQELSRGLERHCMACIDNTIYFIGGLSYESEENRKDIYTTVSEGRIESFKPTVSASHKENEDLISPWDWKLPPMSVPRHSSTTFTLGRKIYVIGGSSKGHSAGVGLVEVFDVDTQEWSDSFTLPSANHENVTSAVLAFPKGIWRKREGHVSKLDPTPEQTIEDVICEQTKRWVLW